MSFTLYKPGTDYGRIRFLYFLCSTMTKAQYKEYMKVDFGLPTNNDIEERIELALKITNE